MLDVNRIALAEMLHGPHHQAFSRGAQSNVQSNPWTGKTRRNRTTACAAKVYIAATHLEGMDRVESLLQALGRNAEDVISLHTMTIIEEAAEDETGAKACGTSLCYIVHRCGTI